MVFTAFIIVPLIAIITAWLIRTIVDLITFLFNTLLGLAILMWFIVNFIWQIIYNCWWYIASSADDLVTLVWPYVKLPFAALIHILKAFGLLSLSVKHLVLRILYCVFLLWIFVYLLMLLYRFITWRDWAIQLKLYMGPTPYHDNLCGSNGRTLTITPVLLDQHCKQCLNPPHII